MHVLVKEIPGHELKGATLMPEAGKKSWARPGQLTPSVFISDFLITYAKVCSFIPIAFLVLRRLPIPAGADSTAHWFFPKIELIWPALLAQEEAVRQRLGDAEATRFGLFLLALVVSLVLMAVRMWVEMNRRSADLLQPQASDALVFVVVLVIVLYPVFGDTGGPKLLFDFVADRWGIFYLRQYLSFLGISWVALSIVFYALGQLVRANRITSEEQ